MSELSSLSLIMAANLAASLAIHREVKWSGKAVSYSKKIEFIGDGPPLAHGLRALDIENTVPAFEDQNGNLFTEAACPSWLCSSQNVFMYYV